MRFWRLAWVLGISLILLAGGLYVARLWLANWLLQRSLPGLSAKVGAVEWENGALVLKKVRIGQNSVGQPMLEVASVAAPWSQKRTIGRIVIDSPTLDLDAASLAKLDELFAAGKTPETPSSHTPFGLDGLDIKNASLRYRATDGITLEGKLNWTGEEISQSADGSLTVARQSLELEPTIASTSDAPQQVPPILAEWSLSGSPRQLHIHSLKTGRPGRILLEPQLLDFLSGPGTSSTSQSQSNAKAKADDAGPPVIESVRFEHLEIPDLEMVFVKCPGLDTPLEGTISLETKPDGKGATAGTWQAKNIRIGPKDASNPAFTGIQGKLQQANDLSGPLLLTDITIAAMPAEQVKTLARKLGLARDLPALPSHMAGQIDAAIPEIVWTPALTSIEKPLTVNCSDFSLATDTTTPAFAKWKLLSLTAAPKELSEGRLRSITWERPEIHWTEAVLKALQPKQSAATPSSEIGSAPDIVWKTDDLRIQDGNVVMEDWGTDMPRITAKLSASTAPLREGEDACYQILLENTTVEHPTDRTLPPFFRGRQIRVDLHPERVFTRKSIETVRFLDSRIDVGATANDKLVMDLPMKEQQVIPHQLPPRSGQEAGEADAINLPEDWHIRRLSLQSTKVHLHHMVPDLAEILLPVSYQTFNDLPLTKAGLEANDEPLRLELPTVHLPGTRPGTSVADLDTNFLHFTLGGLMRKQIDKVQLVNPKIYVGDSLFHYVEKLRTESKSKDPVRVALSRTVLTLLAQLGGESMELPAEEQGWTIHKLQAVNGQLVTTVKDSPLIRVPPLPFGAESSLKDSQINAQLAIPAGIYKPVLGLELVTALKGGSIKFNLPRRQEKNNLVQVFEADWLRFKQLRISEVKLSVTYDEFGIYVQFWADAYGGYLRGEFNLYLTDNFSWDGWVSLTEIDTKALTEAISPATFSLTGKLSGKIIAQGDKVSLYQASGKIQGTEGGKMKILALEEIVKSIPEEWQQIQRDVVLKLLETIRDFRWEGIDGDLRFYGIEGQGKLKLRGPDGERNIELHSHNRRVR